MKSHAFTYSEKPLTVTFDKCTREPREWKEEIRAVAHDLANDAGARPIIVCAGGGVSSEVACRTLFEEGIHFSVLTIERVFGTSREDIEYARVWCKTHGIEQKIIQLDVSNFFSHHIERYIDEGYISANVFRYFQLYLLETIESLGGYAVLGGGSQLYEIANGGAKNNVPAEEDVYMEYGSGFTVPLKWMDTHKKTHRPYFYLSTPEACLAYLRIPIVDFAMRNPNIFSHKTNKQLFKRLVFQTIWPDLVQRQIIGGDKKIRVPRSEKQATLKNRFQPSIDRFRLPVVQFRQQLEGV